MGYFQTGGAPGGGLANVVEDLSPQLGGNLDVNSKSIVSTTAGNIVVTPDTTGSIILDGLSWPQADGAAGQILKTNGIGQLSWVTGSGAINSVFGRTGIVVSANGDYSASQVSNTPAGNIAAITVQAAIAELDAEKAAATHTHVKADVTDFAHTHTTADITGIIIFNGLTYPTIDGANGQVMTTDGAGSLSWSTVSGGGGEVSVDSGTMSIAPSAGGIVDCVAVGNGAVVAAGSIEAIAVGKSRASGGVAFAAMINNNTASYGAIGTGALAFGLLAFASGNYTLAQAGNGNRATSNYATSVGGNANTASGINAANLGGNNNTAGGMNAANLGGSFNVASGSYSVTNGNGAVADKYGQHTQNSGVFAAAGDCQISTLVARGTTTLATATEIFLDGAAARLTVPPNTTWRAKITVVGRQSGGTAGVVGDSFSQTAECVIKRDAANNTALVGAATYGTAIADAAAATWSIAATADDVNNSLKINVTGELNKSIHWSAKINLVEIS